MKGARKKRSGSILVEKSSQNKKALTYNPNNPSSAEGDSFSKNVSQPTALHETKFNPKPSSKSDLEATNVLNIASKTAAEISTPTLNSTDNAAVRGNFIQAQSNLVDDSSAMGAVGPDPTTTASETELFVNDYPLHCLLDLYNLSMMQKFHSINLRSLQNHNDYVQRKVDELEGKRLVENDPELTIADLGEDPVLLNRKYVYLLLTLEETAKNQLSYYDGVIRFNLNLKQLFEQKQVLSEHMLQSLHGDEELACVTANMLSIIKQMERLRVNADLENRKAKINKTVDETMPLIADTDKMLDIKILILQYLEQTEELKELKQHIIHEEDEDDSISKVESGLLMESKLDESVDNQVKLTKRRESVTKRKYTRKAKLNSETTEPKLVENSSKEENDGNVGVIRKNEQEIAAIVKPNYIKPKIRII